MPFSKIRWKSENEPALDTEPNQDFEDDAELRFKTGDGKRKTTGGIVESYCLLDETRSVFLITLIRNNRYAVESIIWSIDELP